MNEATLTHISIDGLRIAEVVVGNGTPVVLLHGWGASIDLMLPLANRLAPLGYRAYVPDLPGFGHSDPPPSAWSAHDYTNFVVAYLNHHGLKQVTLVGHSFGGRIGIVLGAQHGARVDKVVLIDSAGIRPRQPWRLRARTMIYKAARDGLRAVGLRDLSERLRAWYGERYGSADFKAASGVLRETFVKVVNEDLLPYTARIAAPTFLFWGEDDADTPLWMGQLLEKTIPDAALHVFRGAGHYSYLDKPAETTRIIDAFLRQP